MITTESFQDCVLKNNSGSVVFRIYKGSSQENAYRRGKLL